MRYNWGRRLGAGTLRRKLPSPVLSLEQKGTYGKTNHSHQGIDVRRKGKGGEVAPAHRGGSTPAARGVSAQGRQSARWGRRISDLRIGTRNRRASAFWASRIPERGRARRGRRGKEGRLDSRTSHSEGSPPWRGPARTESRLSKIVGDDQRDEKGGNSLWSYQVKSLRTRKTTLTGGKAAHSCHVSTCTEEPAPFPKKRVRRGQNKDWLRGGGVAVRD